MTAKKVKFDVEGMTCAACSATVEKTVDKLAVTNKVSVNLITKSMEVEISDDEKKDLDKSIEMIEKAVENAGYHAVVASDGGKDFGEEEEKKLKQLKKRLIISLIFTIPLLVISMGHMVGMPLPSIIDPMINPLNFGLAQLFLTLPVVILGRPFYSTGFKTLIKRHPNMDSLIAIGTGAALFYSIYALIQIIVGLTTGNAELVSQFVMDLYFESAAVILTLVTLGKFLEARATSKTSMAIKKLMDLSPQTAFVLIDGDVKEISADLLKKDDIMVIKPGASIPADGIVIKGKSSINESMLTGESMPVLKNKADSVYCGSVNIDGYMEVKVEKIGKDTSLAKIIKLVEDAQSQKAPIAKLADKISSIFVPTVLIIALVATLVWLFLGYSFSFALSIGIAVLVISCPCALGLATPTAIMVATGKGAELGILIKGGESLERAHEVTTVVIDKTGTITEGRPEVVDFDYFGSDEDRSKNLLYARVLESKSEHPIGKGIVKYLDENNAFDNHFIKQISSNISFENFLGKGLVGQIDNQTIAIGNLKLMRQLNVDISKANRFLSHFSEQGKSLIYGAIDKKLILLFALSDQPRETSIQAIQNMQSKGLEVIMLTGDNKQTASAIQKEVGVYKAIAEVLPEDKSNVIKELQEQGKVVAMVGDGINDSPALAQADVGIAIGSGTDVAIESADIVLMKNDLLDVQTAIDLSHGTIKNIKQNLFWAFFYNSIGIPIAAGVFFLSLGFKLDPMIAAAAMSLSSVTVVGNALRLKGFKPSRGSSFSNDIANDKEGYELITLHQKDDEMIKEDKKEMNQMNYELKVEGMMCGHCKGRVEKAVSDMEGVSSVEVNLDDKSVKVTSSDSVTLEKIVSAITQAGYEVV